MGLAMAISRRRFRGGCYSITGHGGWWPQRASLHKSQSERLIALRLKHSLPCFRAFAMQKQHGSLNSNLGSDLDHPPRRNLKIVRGVIRRAAHRDEQVILPL